MNHLQNVDREAWKTKPPKLGKQVCQCAACGTYFSGLGAFDDHRLGPIENRRCATMEEMLDPTECALEAYPNGILHSAY